MNFQQAISNTIGKQAGKAVNSTIKTVVKDAANLDLAKTPQKLDKKARRALQRQMRKAERDARRAAQKAKRKGKKKIEKELGIDQLKKKLKKIDKFAGTRLSKAATAISNGKALNRNLGQMVAGGVENAAASKLQKANRKALVALVGKKGSKGALDTLREAQAKAQANPADKRAMKDYLAAAKDVKKQMSRLEAIQKKSEKLIRIGEIGVA